MASRRKKWSQLTKAEQASERSKRANKGWQTRWKKKRLASVRGDRERALNVIRALSDADRQVVLAALRGDTEMPRVMKLESIDKIRRTGIKMFMTWEEQVKDAGDRILRTVEEATGQQWVNAVDPKFLRRGTRAMAIEPCEARVTMSSKEFWNVHITMKQAEDEYGKDSIELKETAMQLSQIYDISIREVWTIMMSP